MYRQSSLKTTCYRDGSFASEPVPEMPVRTNTIASLLSYLVWLIPKFLKKFGIKKRMKALLGAYSQELEIIRHPVRHFVLKVFPEKSDSFWLDRIGATRGIKRREDDDGLYAPRLTRAYRTNLNAGNRTGHYEAFREIGFDVRTYESTAIAVNQMEPPENPKEREIYIIGGSNPITFDSWEDGEEPWNHDDTPMDGYGEPTGEFAGHAYELAMYEDDQWHFVMPPVGTVMNVLEFDYPVGRPYRFDGECWKQHPEKQHAHYIVQVVDWDKKYSQKYLDEILINNHPGDTRAVVVSEIPLKTLDDMVMDEDRLDSFEN